MALYLNVVFAWLHVLEAYAVGIAYQHMTTVDFEYYPLAFAAMVHLHFADWLLCGIYVHGYIAHQSSSSDSAMARLMRWCCSLAINARSASPVGALVVTIPASPYVAGI